MGPGVRSRPPAGSSKPSHTHGHARDPALLISRECSRNSETGDNFFIISSVGFDLNYFQKYLSFPNMATVRFFFAVFILGEFPFFWSFLPLRCLNIFSLFFFPIFFCLPSLHKDEDLPSRREWHNHITLPFPPRFTKLIHFLPNWIIIYFTCIIHVWFFCTALPLIAAPFSSICLINIFF